MLAFNGGVVQNFAIFAHTLKPSPSVNPVSAPGISCSSKEGISLASKIDSRKHRRERDIPVTVGI